MTAHIPPPESLTPGALAWAYLRDSGGDGQEKSVEQQEKIIREYCHRHGLTLAHIFADVAKSGKSEEKRENFLQMIAATTTRLDRPAVLLVWNFARFARNVDDADYYKGTLRKRGIIVHSLTDQIPSGTFGPVVEKFIDVANEEYRRQNSHAVRRALRDLVQAGFAPGGRTPPKGYKAVQFITGAKRDGKPRTAYKWEPDPALAPLVTLAFKMRADGKSYREITAATEGKLYTVVNSWPTFFKNRSYLGIGKCGDDEYPDHHPALVDLATFEAAQAFTKLHPREGLNHPRRIAYPALLSGLATCAACGSSMAYHAAKHRNWPFYVCSKRDRNRSKSPCQARRINARLVEKTIFDVLLSRILTPAFVEELFDDTQRILSNADDIDQRVQEKQKALRLAKQAMSNLLELVETFGAGAAQDKYKQRQAEIHRLEYELTELENQRRALDVEITPDAMEIALATWREKLTQAHGSGDVAALRALMAWFITKIELDDQTAKIFYTFPLDSFYPANDSAHRGGTSLYTHYSRRSNTS